MTRLLLLHGNASSGAVWSRVGRALQFPSEAPDLPGFGAAARSRDSYAETLRRWLGDTPAVVVAAGATSLIAVRVAASQPTLIRHLVLVGPTGLSGGHGRLASVGRSVSGAALLRMAGTTLGRARFLGDQLAHPESAPAEVTEALLEGLRCARSFAALARESGELCSHDAAGVNCPIDVLWGARSGVQPVDEAPEFMRRLPSHARLHVIADSGHALALEAPAAVALTIGEAIRAHAHRGDRSDRA